MTIKRQSAPILAKYSSMTLWAVFLLLLLASCREKDKRLPFVNVETPVDGSEWQACDEITVKGTFADDGGLSQALIRLDESSSELKTIVYSGEIEADFEVKVKLGDRYLSGGQYKLEVTVVDLSGNSNTAFVDLFIAAIPLQLEQIAVASTDPQGMSTFYTRRLEANSFNQRGSETHFKAMKADARGQSYLLLSGNSPQLEARDPEAFQPLYSLPIPGGTALAIQDRDVVVGAESSPYLSRYKTSGANAGTYPDALKPVTAVLLTEAALFTGSRDMSSFAYSIQQYKRNTGQVVGSQTLDFRAERLLNDGKGHILALGNANGQLRMTVLDSLTLSIIGNEALGESFLQAVIGSEKCYLLSDAGLRIWDPLSQQLSGVVLPGSFSALAYEKVANEIWLGSPNTLTRYNTALQAISSESGPFSNPIALSLLYNK